MLSNTCKYALSAVLFLGKNCNNRNERYNIKEICQEINVPKPYLSKILQELARHQVISSTKGPHGGFGLSKSLEEITVSQIIEVFEGKDYFHRCIIRNADCAYEGKHEQCALHNRYAKVNEQTLAFFDQTKLSDIILDMEGHNYQ